MPKALAVVSAVFGIAVIAGVAYKAGLKGDLYPMPAGTMPTSAPATAPVQNTAMMSSDMADWSFMPDENQIYNEDGTPATWAEMWADGGVESNPPQNNNGFGNIAAGPNGTPASAAAATCTDVTFKYPANGNVPAGNVTAKCKITKDANIAQNFAANIQQTLTASVKAVCDARPSTCKQTGCKNGTRTTTAGPTVTVGVTPGYPKDKGTRGKEYCYTVTQATCESKLTCVPN